LDGRAREERQSKLEEITANGAEPWNELDREFQAYPDDIRRLLEEFLNLRVSG
jgi:hypothetical protein